MRYLPDKYSIAQVGGKNQNHHCLDWKKKESKFSFQFSGNRGRWRDLVLQGHMEQNLNSKPSKRKKKKFKKKSLVKGKTKSI